MLSLLLSVASVDDGWYALGLGILFMAFAIGVAFLILGLWLRARSIGLGKTVGLLLTIAGAVLPFFCFWLVWNIV
jgi:hypothetical protein